MIINNTDTTDVRLPGYEIRKDQAIWLSDKTSYMYIKSINSILFVYPEDAVIFKLTFNL